LTLEFARKNLENEGYKDIVLVKGDGGLGYAKMAPYDRICITAACLEIPPPLIEQLRIEGRLIGPMEEISSQNLVLFEKSIKGIRKKRICEVLYVSLRRI
jgi:protein-L-isoaspartate(D-aspartate) O-methyltransferase